MSKYIGNRLKVDLKYHLKVVNFLFVAFDTLLGSELAPCVEVDRRLGLPVNEIESEHRPWIKILFQTNEILNLDDFLAKILKKKTIFWLIGLFSDLSILELK